MHCQYKYNVYYKDSASLSVLQGQDVSLLPPYQDAPESHQMMLVKPLKLSRLWALDE